MAEWVAIVGAPRALDFLPGGAAPLVVIRRVFRTLCPPSLVPDSRAGETKAAHYLRVRIS